MKIVANRSKFSNDHVREIIRIVRPPGISTFSVEIGNRSWGSSGRAKPWSNKVRINLDAKWKYPFVCHATKDGKRAVNGYLPVKLLTLEEDLVYVIAHELRHLWQYKHTRGKAWGARGRYSELDACAFGINRLREWRRQKGYSRNIK